MLLTLHMPDRAGHVGVRWLAQLWSADESLQVAALHGRHRLTATRQSLWL